MRAMLRQFRRAPARIVASIFALSLAVGAIGVFAIPAVSEGTLHESAVRDGLPDIVMWTSDVTPATLRSLAEIDGVAAAEGEISTIVDRGDHDVTLVGLDFEAQTMDRLHLTEGRLPAAAGEAVVDDSVDARVGDVLELDGTSLRVVGVGDTLWFADAPTAYTDLATTRAISGVDGTNRLVVTAEVDDIDTLRRISGGVRDRLAVDGATFTDFPVHLPDGETPIDADIEQVSSLIGLLGFVAALVALVLLASTTNTLVTERTREVAVMRALGAQGRPLRRRLRRIALGIAAASLVVGLPLGVLISNLIARMVLEKFVGVTPDIGISIPVLAASAVGTLLGARLVAARAARRVTALPLAEALRDRDGAPFGRRWTDRLAARMPLGGLRTRMATRASLHRRARAVSVIAQITVGVGALVTIAGLTSSVTDYNEGARQPWQWASITQSSGPGLAFPADAVDASTGSESGVWVFGQVDGWDVDVFGFHPSTAMFAPSLVDGRWIDDAPDVDRPAVVSSGFAEHEQIEIGDTLAVELASGTVAYDVVGLVDDHARAVYADASTVAGDLGSPGMANVAWSMDAAPTFDLGVTASRSTAAEQDEADGAGRDAIVAIFGALGAIVAGVAMLAVASTMAVNLFERRHELAAVQAIGGRRRQLRGLVARELLPLGLVGTAFGLVAGWAGTVGIIASFEASNAVDIPAVFAIGAAPAIVAATVMGLLLLTRLAVRGAVRRPIAVTLRGAA